MIALNRAVAVAMRDGPDAGLALLEPLLLALPGYQAAPAVAADLCRRAGRLPEARSHYRAAIDLARQEPERRSTRSCRHIKSIHLLGNRSPP